MRFGAIATRDYLAHVRALACSLEEQRIGPLTVLLVDDEDAVLGDEPFEIVRPVDVGVDWRELHHMAAIYDASELAMALKPALLTALLERDGDVAFLLDADLQIFHALDDVGSLARRSGLVLTPNSTSPYPTDGQLPSERELLLAGVFNGGFLVVGERGRPFLSWWGERLRRDCRAAPAEGFNRDQRWLDLAPAYFEHVVLTDPGYNVAYWNLHERNLTRSGDTYLVNGRPLRFFHFSGYSPRSPDVLSRYAGAVPRTRLADHPVVRELCDGYRDLLLRAGYDDAVAQPYRYGSSALGFLIDPYVRGAYRRALHELEARNAPVELPDPFDRHQAADFHAWVIAPVTDRGAPRLARYLVELHAQRPDIQQAYPNLGDAATRRAFMEWVGAHFELYGARREWITAALDS